MILYLLIQRINAHDPRDLLKDDAGEPSPYVDTQIRGSVLILDQPQAILQIVRQRAKVVGNNAAANPFRLILVHVAR